MGSFIPINITRVTPPYHVPPSSPCPCCTHERPVTSLNHLIPLFLQGSAGFRDRHHQARSETLPLIPSGTKQVCFMPTQRHKVTHDWHGDVHTWTDTRGTQTCVHRDRGCAQRCMRTNRCGTPDLPRLRPHPPPGGRLPCQVQLSRPKQIPADKDTAFELEPFPLL